LKIYTKMINLFSQFNPQRISGSSGSFRNDPGNPPVISRFTVGNVTLEVLEGLGAIPAGRSSLFPDPWLIFAADSVINFGSRQKSGPITVRSQHSL